MNDINWNITEEPLSETGMKLMTVFGVEDSKKAITEKFSLEVDKLVKIAGSLVISNADSAKDAVELGATARRLMKAIDAKIEELTADAKSYQKAVKAYGETFTGRLKYVYDHVSKKLTIYQSWLELERRKTEEVQRKATEEFQKTLDAEAAKAGIEAPKVEAPMLPETKTTIKSDGATAFTGGRWKATVTDESLVPREYCSPDSKKINSAIRAGVRQIPGVDIRKDEKVRIRT